jgi:hypothetical protein
VKVNSQAKTLDKTHKEMSDISVSLVKKRGKLADARVLRNSTKRINELGQLHGDLDVEL